MKFTMKGSVSESRQTQPLKDLSGQPSETSGEDTFIRLGDGFSPPKAALIGYPGVYKYNVASI